jgi:hypothetical protein
MTTIFFVKGFVFFCWLIFFKWENDINFCKYIWFVKKRMSLFYWFDNVNKREDDEIMMNKIDVYFFLFWSFISKIILDIDD